MYNPLIPPLHIFQEYINRKKYIKERRTLMKEGTKLQCEKCECAIIKENHKILKLCSLHQRLLALCLKSGICVGYSTYSILLHIYSTILKNKKKEEYGQFH